MTGEWPVPSAPLTSQYWDDPRPTWQGMLSSDLIAFYNSAIGGMIGPWCEDLLKPASYELTLGATYVIDGKVTALTQDNPWLEIPSNSIVFVSMEQWVRLPHYIAARFDLAIEFIYQGILLGTGPQVDPGFQGYLSCPLHNISNDSVHIRLGNPFAKMDFAKTSGLAAARVAGALNGLSNEDDLAAAAITKKLPGDDGQPVKLFNRDKRWRTPITDPGYAGNRAVSSSVKRLEGDLDQNRVDVAEFGDEIRRLRRFGLGAALVVFLAVIGLLLTLAQLDRDYTDSKLGGVQGNAPPAAILALERRIQREDIFIQRLRKTVRQLTRASRRLKNP